jgi:hypothetical protein
MYSHQKQVYANFDNRNMQIIGNGVQNLPNQQSIHPNSVYINPAIHMHSQNPGGSKTTQQLPPRHNMNGTNNYMHIPPTPMMRQPIYYNNMTPYNIPLRN